MESRSRGGATGVQTARTCDDARFTTTAGRFPRPVRIGPGDPDCVGGSGDPFARWRGLRSPPQNEKKVRHVARRHLVMGPRKPKRSPTTRRRCCSRASTPRRGLRCARCHIELFEDSESRSRSGRCSLIPRPRTRRCPSRSRRANGPIGLITALVAAGGSTVIATGTNVLAQGDLYANQAALRPVGGHAKWMMTLHDAQRLTASSAGDRAELLDRQRRHGPADALGWPCTTTARWTAR